MTAEEMTKDIEGRILADINHFEGDLPERYSIAWNGYIASLYEFSIIGQEHYAKLSKLLPKVEPPDPILDIFEGRHDDDD